MPIDEVAVVSAGMRGKDLRKILLVARDFKVIILVRHTNKLSLPYVAKPGFYPKPIFMKAKTADTSPPVSRRVDMSDETETRTYTVGGLVVHPGIQPNCFLKEEKKKKAAKAWADTLEHLDATMAALTVDPNNPATLAPWGLERNGSGPAKGWKWRVDINPDSDFFGCLQIKSDGRSLPWSYVHGDYDLKDVIVPGRETENKRRGYYLGEGVWNWTPKLHGMEFESVRRTINKLIGVDMLQHGAEAQFAWHGDEPITIAFPDWSYLILVNAEAVQSWYEQRHRAVRGKKGTDYLKDESRMFKFDPEGGGWIPGKRPGETAGG